MCIYNGYWKSKTKQGTEDKYKTNTPSVSSGNDWVSQTGLKGQCTGIMFRNNYFYRQRIHYIFSIYRKGFYV